MSDISVTGNHPWDVSHPVASTMQVVYMDANSARSKRVYRMLSNTQATEACVVTMLPTSAATVEHVLLASAHIVLLNISIADAKRGVVAQVHAAAPHIPIVVISEQLTEALLLRLVREGAYECLLEDHLNAVVLTLSLQAAIERQRSKERVTYLATHDALTGLPNRALFNDRVEYALAVSERTNVLPVLFMIDVETFKEINDTLGHQYGDNIFHMVAMRLQETLRASDTIARLGGDEFAVLLYETNAASVPALAQRIVDVITEPMYVEPHTLVLGCSVGITIAQDDDTDAAQLLRQAGIAMYTAKRNGGGIEHFDSTQQAQSTSQLNLAGDLRQALDNSEFVLHYQPLIDVLHGAITGVEALIRWNHPTKGLISPDQFIPEAEKTGLITPLTLWVLNEAIAQAKEWDRKGIHVAVSVNISRRTLHQLTLPDTVRKLLRDYEFPAERLILEITESALMAELERVKPVFDELSTLGVHLAMDDFGIGHSSLSSLRRMPVDSVKIDKSFLLQVAAGSAHDASIVAYTIGLGHALGLKVICEGVETQEVWDMLESLGCDSAQGFHMSRPLEAHKFEEWVATTHWQSASAVRRDITE